MQKTVEELVELAKKFYKDNGLDIPNNVTQYTARFPPGYSRQTLKSKYNIQCSDFVELLNPAYKKVKTAGERATIEAARLNYTLLTDPSTLPNNRCSVTLRCNDCGHEHTTTVTSLQGTKLGCPKCKSGNLPWSSRSEELVKLLSDIYDATLVSEIPHSQTGYLTVRHNTCGTEYTTLLVGFVSPTTNNRATCPNCRSSDRRVTHKGITFGSQFELDCYKVIEHLNPEVQVRYSSYLNTTRYWVCDFKLGSTWIEVSNFKQDYKGYFANIEEKCACVEHAGDKFFFIKSIKSMQELLPLIS